MQFANSLSYQADLKYIRQLMDIPTLQREDEFNLTQAWYENKDEKALHNLITAYSRLVIGIAMRYRNYGLPFADLIQEGNLGLLRAAESFEPNRELRFSTYAKWWIKAYLQDYILKNWSIVRTGSTTAHKVLFFNLKRLKKQFANINTDYMATEEQQKIAEILKVSIEDVKIMEDRLGGIDLSLSNFIKEDSQENWQDLLIDPNPSPEEISVADGSKQVQQRWIEKALERLNVRERYIICQRRLIEPPTTLEAIGKNLSITKERVRQLETKAIRKMRYYFIENMMDFRQNMVL